MAEATVTGAVEPACVAEGVVVVAGAGVVGAMGLIEAVVPAPAAGTIPAA